MTPHKQWLDNEYCQWIAALNESTVHNFKEHPMVKRMLGELDAELWQSKIAPSPGMRIWETLLKIDRIGRDPSDEMSATGLRMIYYACAIKRRNPSSICEIGGGVGQFYAILRALGYQGEYYIFDLPEVKNFQYKYLEEVSKQTGLSFDQHTTHCDLVVSFYALGEFNDELKQRYFDSTVNHVDHGYIAWNPHSGANDDLSIFSKQQITVTPGVEEGIKIIEW